MSTGLLRSVRSRKVAVGLSAALLVGAGYLLFVLTLPAPNLWITMTASTERLAFKVANPDLAAIRITGMEAFTQDGKLSGCVSGILQPALGASVEYRRGDDSYYQILVDPPSPAAGPTSTTFRAAGAASTTVVTTSLILRARESCGSAPKRLPVWGDGELGERARPAGARGDIVPGLLISGTVSTYARSHPVLLGLDFPSTIYLVNSFDVPAGSVLTRDATKAPPLWTGTASVADNGFDVYLSTLSRSIALRAPSIEAGAQASSIDLGSYTQFLSDPNIIKVQFVAGIFLFMFQFMLSVTAFIFDTGGE